jgi:hypothetical protein
LEMGPGRDLGGDLERDREKGEEMVDQSSGQAM